MRPLALAAIRLYQRILSPVMPPACRYQPTCSRYGYEAIDRYGVWRGGRLTVRRLLRCTPLHPMGIDPVPALPGDRWQQDTEARQYDAEGRRHATTTPAPSA